MIATTHSPAIEPAGTSRPPEVWRGRVSGVVVRLAITEPRGPDAQKQGCENHDGQSADHRADEGGNEHLCTSKRERRGREACERYRRHEDQHERVDQPGHAHIRIDAGKRRDQRAREARKPGPDAERDEAHMAAIDTKPSRELFVHDHRARLKAEPGCIQERCNAARYHRRSGNEKETIEGIRLSNDTRSPRDRRLYELNLAA